ncbi:cation-translocating P-type ATPase [Ramlibacter alkalitolerans]|uniref:cation-translocating P-type ATPase n=1 Tax=Ramlibacter alkalitolerans TaxID=2039631 RepID=UPI002ED3D564
MTPGTWHLREAADVAREHTVDPTLGLDLAEVRTRAGRHGPNELPSAPPRSLASLLAEQFRDLMILVLVGAALISGVLGDWVDTLVIVVIVVLNAAIGIVQAWRADRALAALKQLAAAHAVVLRAGRTDRIPAHALVPGDVVLLEAGNQVPADLRLFESVQLRIDESALTGESVTVAKQTGVPAGETHALGDRTNMAYKGTTATQGRGRGLVVATGRTTELGQMAHLLAQGGWEPTPLQRRLSAFGKRLALAVLGICVLVFAAGLLRGEPALLMLLTAVSLAVAAIPEAMPAVVTVLLALGARRMVAINALVRRLASVETLGSVTWICSDKTGTLTQNRMRAETLRDGQGLRWDAAQSAAPAACELLRAAALCNDAQVARDGALQGDPTETALAALAASAGLQRAALERQSPRIAEEPFDATVKRMSTWHGDAAGVVGYTKGAPELLLPLCEGLWHPAGATALDHAHWLQQAEAMAGEGLRVLAFARRALPAPPEAGDVKGLQFLGLVGLIDPPREEAAAAVRECLAAGIAVAMITGDHPATARAIAWRLGIVRDPRSPVLTGAQLAGMDAAALAACVREVRVYARVDPLQKIRIVQALQAHGELVAMTGDGVNDAPALQRADIGVAMGRGGTDVARGASSLVLLDDNFATIAASVREGRRIYDNIRKFVRYALTGNAGEIGVIFLAPLLGLPLPLLPIHILWINLVTDGLPGLALAAEPAERNVMQRPPRPPAESLLARGLWQQVLVAGLLLAGLCLGVQAWALHVGDAHWQTMVFTVLTFGQLALVLGLRSEATPLWRLGLFSNVPLLLAVLLSVVLQLATVYVPWLNPVFRTQPLTAMELGWCLALAALVWAAVEAGKAWCGRPAG